VIPVLGIGLDPTLLSFKNEYAARYMVCFAKSLLFLKHMRGWSGDARGPGNDGFVCFRGRQ
jgi:hypothetical protein